MGLYDAGKGDLAGELLEKGLSNAKYRKIPQHLLNGLSSEDASSGRQWLVGSLGKTSIGPLAYGLRLHDNTDEATHGEITGGAPEKILRQPPGGAGEADVGAAYGLLHAKESEKGCNLLHSYTGKLRKACKVCNDRLLEDMRQGIRDRYAQPGTIRHCKLEGGVCGAYQGLAENWLCVVRRRDPVREFFHGGEVLTDWAKDEDGIWKQHQVGVVPAVRQSAGHEDDRCHCAVCRRGLL